MTATHHDGPTVSLDDRYTVNEGQVMLNGTQALVRLLLTQSRLDRERGLRTGTFVSGYQGSPLGGLDTEIMRSERFLDPAGVVFQAGVNEELAATAVGGTQLLEEVPGRTKDGVVGFWYGKTPGLDRSADAIRHANVSGTSHLGGAVAVIGDDPMCKSSTLPGSCEALCRSLMLPLLTPSSMYEIVELGLHAVALSRETGVWAGLKIISDLADSSANVAFGDETADIPLPPTQSRGKPPVLLAPTSLAAEQDLFTTRWTRVKEYSRRVGLNRITFDASRATIGIVAAGGSYATLTRALRQLGVDDDALEQMGVRLIQLRMSWPLSDHDVDLLGGLEQVLVVEDKLAFVESQLKELCYGRAEAPRILGKHDANGSELLSSYGSLEADAVMLALARLLPWDRLHADSQPVFERLVRPPAQPKPESAAPTPLTVLPSRTAFFCSGCPHNLSTRAEPDQLVGAGIGCHVLVAFDPAGTRGNIIGAPQMGGEGGHWLGLAAFTEEKHWVQNIGDGTFHHSGSLAVRAAVAAGVSMTFKLLYNDAVAMTGGQQAVGRMTVPSLTELLEAEGVRKTVVVTVEPETYRSVDIASSASVRHRDDLDAVEADLADTEGVTVLIYDDRCATEERRMRKRKQLPVVTERVWINERVCEGCGDCGEKSSCLSVVPVQTEFGRKTHIDQASCNSDMSCLKGDCPSFVMVDVDKLKKRGTPPEPSVTLTEPDPAVSQTDYLLRMPGVGGTGVVTVSQVLQMAAMLDGKYSAGLDQTGLAQKGGAVVSDVRISDEPIEGGVRASRATVDVLLGLDAVGSINPTNLSSYRPGHTIAVVNTGVLATASMVVGVGDENPDIARARSVLDAVTDRSRNVYLDALRLSQILFGDNMPANLMMLGAAYQKGLIPVSARVIEQAIELNGTGKATNLAAFRWGRAFVLDPSLESSVLGTNTPEAEPIDDRARELVREAGVQGELAESLTTRLSDLIGYQSVAYARRFLASVLSVHATEERVLGAGADSITQAHAHALHKLMAYKDEYEVARLHLLDSEQRRMTREFGPDVKTRIMLHPPILRAMGMQNKIGLGVSARPAFVALRTARKVRGTRLDPFGATRIRRLERALIEEYETSLRDALNRLGRDNVEAVRGLVELVDGIRGYEGVKERHVAAYRDNVRTQQALIGQR